MQTPKRLRITQSLLAAWSYVYLSDDGYQSFIDVLNRIPKEPTQAMLDGTEFEHCVNLSLDGFPVPAGHKWAGPVNQLTRYLKGSQQQVTIYREIDIDGQAFVLHGIMDFLRAGICFDTKFSKTYHLNKYLDSPQHSMYFALAPDVYEFQYLISDGSYVYRETYRPEYTEPIENKIRQFVKFLKRSGNWETYCRLWDLEGYKKYELCFSLS